jgi:hypothetical protein
MLRDKLDSTEIEVTSAMIEAGVDVLMGCFGPDYYGREEPYLKAALETYRAMVAKRSQK